MKLHHSVASPFVRKVMVLAIETGLDGRLELVTPDDDPGQAGCGPRQDNPLGKIPCLVTDDGAALYDSRVICEYLDSLHGGPRCSRRGRRAGRALRRQAEGDGIMDAGVLARYETFLRPEERRWPEWLEGQKLKFRRALDALEAEAEDVRRHLDIGTITIGCALGYLDFRYADEDWRHDAAAARRLVRAFRERPSMAGPHRSRSGEICGSAAGR